MTNIRGIVEIFALLLVFVAGLGLLARRVRIPYPILFVVGGLLVSFIPHLPPVRLNPDLVFFLFLPPLLYIQAFNTSWRDFRRELRAILLLAIGLVIATTVIVARISHWLIPDFPLVAGFILGAIISPPDAVAASAIAQSLGLPRRLVTILEGESLVNDATGLVALQISLAALAAGVSNPLTDNFSLPGQFLYISLGGIAIGLAIGWGTARIRRYLIDEDPAILLTLSLLTPFVSYLAAQPLGVSGVLAVVSTGLYLGWESPAFVAPATRLQAQAVWSLIVYLLNGIIFILIGLQLPNIVRQIRDESWSQLFCYAVIVNAACILVRLFWIFPGAYLPRLIGRWFGLNETLPNWREVLIAGWCGMRGVVSLAAALTLEGVENFPQAHLVQFLAFSVILTTLVLQGLTLPPLIRWLGVASDGSAAREEREARNRIAATVKEKLVVVRREKKYPVAAIDSIDNFYRERSFALEDELAEQLGWSDRRHHVLSLRRLRRSILAAQRRTLLDMRQKGMIGDDVMHQIEHELDIEETQLKG